jgi:hypothetical protein
MTEEQRQEIARLVMDGYTSGRLDCDGEYLAWELNVNILKEEE